MRKVPFYIVLMLLLLCGCKGERMYSRLMEIRTIAIDHPDSALTLLDSLKPQMAEWPKSDRMRYESIVVGDGVWIGARATILPGVQIGDGAVVAAGAVVTRDVAANSLVAGVPAKTIRELS